MSYQITSTPQVIQSASQARLRLYNSGSTVYYKTTDDVSSDSSDGTIVDGASYTLSGRRFFCTAPDEEASLSDIDVDVFGFEMTHEATPISQGAMEYIVETLASGGVATLPHVRVTNTVSQVLPAADSGEPDFTPIATPTILTFDTEEYKSTASMHDNDTDTSRLVAPVAGLYAVSAYVQTAAIGGTAFVILNGTTAISGSGSPFINQQPFALNCSLRLEANDYLEIKLVTLDGTASATLVNTDHGSDIRPSFEMVLASA